MANWLCDDELIQNAYTPVSIEDIGNYEAELGFKLPEEYRDFLLWQNGGECPSYVAAGDSQVDVFYALQHSFSWADLVGTRPGWSNLFPDRFLAFASTAWGDYFCINRDDNKIYLLWHDEPIEDFAALTPEANSLREFLSTLYRELPDNEQPQVLPEFEAVRQGDRNRLQSLLQSQTQANLTNDEGRFLLHYAIGLWRRGMVSDLLATGASTETKEDDGHTALFDAGSAQAVDIGRLLINADANINAVNKVGKSVLMHTIGCGNIRLALELIAAGADVNYRAPDGRTALACCTDHSSRQYVAPVLLATGASRSV